MRGHRESSQARNHHIAIKIKSIMWSWKQLKLKLCDTTKLTCRIMWWVWMNIYASKFCKFHSSLQLLMVNLFSNVIYFNFIVSAEKILSRMFISAGAILNVHFKKCVQTDVQGNFWFFMNCALSLCSHQL